MHRTVILRAVLFSLAVILTATASASMADEY